MLTQLRNATANSSPVTEKQRNKIGGEIVDTNGGKLQLNTAKSQIKILEERLRAVNAEIGNKEKEFKSQFDQQQQVMTKICKFVQYSFSIFFSFRSIFQLTNFFSSSSEKSERKTNARFL